VTYASLAPGMWYTLPMGASPRPANFLTAMSFTIGCRLICGFRPGYDAVAAAHSVSLHRTCIRCALPHTTAQPMTRDQMSTSLDGLGLLRVQEDDVVLQHLVLAGVHAPVGHQLCSGAASAVIS
jgi:hypothetical protein